MSTLRAIREAPLTRRAIRVVVVVGVSLMAIGSDPATSVTNTTLSLNLVT